MTDVDESALLLDVTYILLVGHEDKSEFRIGPGPRFHLPHIPLWNWISGLDCKVRYFLGRHLFIRLCISVSWLVR